jgi:hypothetical protein
MSPSANEIRDTILGGEEGRSPCNPQDFGGGNGLTGTCVVGAEVALLHGKERAFRRLPRLAGRPAAHPACAITIAVGIWCHAVCISRSARQAARSIVPLSVVIVTLMLRAMSERHLVGRRLPLPAMILAKATRDYSLMQGCTQLATQIYSSRSLANKGGEMSRCHCV